MNWNSLLLDIKYNIDRNRLKSQSSNKLDYSNERMNLHYYNVVSPKKINESIFNNLKNKNTNTTNKKKSH